MARYAYSNDIREKVIALVQAGNSRREVARRFDVSPSFVIKTMQRFEWTGNKHLLDRSNPRGGKLSPYRDFIISLIERKSDITLYEMRDQLLDVHGVQVNPASIHLMLMRIGYSFKKNHWQRLSSNALTF